MLQSLKLDRSGGAAVEFGMALPIFLMLLVGTVELGFLLLNHAGLKHAVNAAARQATLYPTPSDDALRARATKAAFGVDRSRVRIDVVHGEDPINGRFVELSGSYTSIPVTSLVLQPRVLTDRRKVWVQEPL